jgi:hypothetical protein
MFGDIKFDKVKYIFYKGKFSGVEANTPASDAKNAHLLLEYFEEINGSVHPGEVQSMLEGNGNLYIWNYPNYGIAYTLYENFGAGEVFCGDGNTVKKAMIELLETAKEAARENQRK